LHNLGVYITEHEASMMIENKSGKERPEILLFEVNVDKNIDFNISHCVYLIFLN